MKQVNVYAEMFNKVHEAGAKRHPLDWLKANQLAAKTITDTGNRIDDPALKAVVSLVALRLLDWLRPSGTPESPTDENIKATLAKLAPTVTPDTTPPLFRAMQGVPDP